MQQHIQSPTLYYPRAYKKNFTHRRKLTKGRSYKIYPFVRSESNVETETRTTTDITIFFSSPIPSLSRLGALEAEGV